MWFCGEKTCEHRNKQGLYDGISSFKYENTCIDCRTNIADVIGSIIEF